MRKLTIIIADDHYIFRTGLKKLISRIACVGSISEAANGNEVLELLAASTYDLVLLDIEMPVLNGIKTLDRIKEKFPTVKVVMLSSFSDEGQLEELYKRQIDGYLLKNTGFEELKRALVNIEEGERYFSQEIADTLYSLLLKKEQKTSHLPIGLTEREKEVLLLVCKQYTTSEIADMLNLSVRTIERFRENLLVKTNSKNSVGLVLYALSEGLIKKDGF